MKRGNKQPLSEKAACFVQEYLLDLNATQAAIRAGYSEATAYSQGQRLLKHVEVKKAIAAAKKERAERMAIKQDRVLAELARVAFFDMRRLYDAKGNLIPVHELDTDTAAALAGLDVIEQQTVEVDADGNVQPVPTFLKKYK